MAKRSLLSEGPSYLHSITVHPESSMDNSNRQEAYDLSTLKGIASCKWRHGLKVVLYIFLE